MIRIALFLMALFLNGCTYAAPPGMEHPSRVICRIDVIASQDGALYRHSYTDPEKMATVMNYLRRVGPDLSTAITPDTFRTDAYRITLSLSDGQQTVYHQIHDSYLQENGGVWHSIDPALGATLPELLWQLPSDPS